MRPRSFEPQPRRRRARHLADRLGQRQPLLIADVAAEHARERAGAARMARRDAAVARDHHPRLPVERADVLVDHRGADHAGAAVLDDLDEELDRRLVLIVRDGVERAELVLGMRRMADDQHVRRAADVGERLLDARRVVVPLVGHEDGDRRAPGVVGIRVGGHVDAAARAASISAIAVGRLAPHADGAELDVRNLDRDVRALADRDRFPQRVEALVGLVADVRHVDAAVAGHDFRQLDELAGLGVAADFVFEAARQAGGAFAHPLIDEQRHARDLVGARGALEVVLHHQPAHGRVADERRDVDGGRRAPPLGQVVADRPRRVAVRPDDDRGDALRDLGLGRRIGGQPRGRMIVDVDEAGRDDEAVAVDHGVPGLRLDVADGDDAIVDEADVGAPQRRAAPVREIGADDRRRPVSRAAGRDQRERAGSDAGRVLLDPARRVRTRLGESKSSPSRCRPAECTGHPCTGRAARGSARR